VILSRSTKKCYPECDSFRCQQRALTFRKRRAYCRWADDFCEGPTCNFGSCSRGRMLADGTCGFSIKRRTKEAQQFDDIGKIEVPMTSKVLKKFKGEDLI